MALIYINILVDEPVVLLGSPVNMTSAAVDSQTFLGPAEGPALLQSTSVSLNRCVNKPALLPSGAAVAGILHS